MTWWYKNFTIPMCSPVHNRSLLIHIVPFILTRSVFPEMWKIANIIPLFERMIKYCFNNDRPVSLLLTSSKLLKEIMYEVLLECLNEHKIFVEYEVRDLFPWAILTKTMISYFLNIEKIWNSAQIKLSSTLNFYRRYFFDAWIFTEKSISEIDAD